MLRGRQGYSGGVVPPATFAEGGVVRTPGQIAGRIATIKKAMGLGVVTPEMQEEMRGLMSQLRRSRRRRRR